jgi:hypothetical protein
MKKKLMLVITLLLLGFGGRSLSTPGPDWDYNEAEPWDDIYSQSKNDPTNIDTTSFTISVASCPRAAQVPSPHKLSVKREPLRRVGWSSLWCQIKFFILSFWR